VEPTNDPDCLDALRRWPARADLAVQVAGGVVATLGAAAQAVGLALGLGAGNPVLGERLLTAGFWAGGIGGAGLVYGIGVGAGGSVSYPGGPLGYTPPARRWPSILWAACGIPLWAVLSLPLAVLLYGILAVGGLVVGCVWLVRRFR
jgi:hypothetical protein